MAFIKSFLWDVINSEWKRKRNEMALGSFYTIQLLLYWFTLKDGSEGWLVEPGPYDIRPHTIIYTTLANNRNTLIEQSPRCITVTKIVLYIREQCL